MAKYIVALLLLYIPLNSLYAQVELLSELEKSVSRKIGDKGAIQRMQLDSIDFQFAISVNQGAGFFDIEQKGETWSKLLYSFKTEEDKSILEKSRDSLEIGIGMYAIRRYEMAEKTLRRTKALMEAYNLTHEIVYLRALSNLGLISLTQGKTGDAEKLISQSISISQNTLGKNSAAYIANLNNYAKLHQVLGHYNKAEKEFDMALDYCRNFFGGGMQQAIILNNKAMLFQTLGQFDRSIDFMNKAIEASTKAPKKTFQGSKSFDNRKFKANLATIYQVSGNYLRAESDFLELKKIFENRKQTKNAEYAGLLNQLGILYVQMGKYNLVEDLLVKSSGIYRKRWGENNIYFAKTINDLGNFYRISGDYRNAEKWLNKSFSIRSALLDPSHPDYTKTQEDLAILHWKSGNIEEAYSLYKAVMGKTIYNINRYFPPMSEAEKTKFWEITSLRFHRFYNFALENHTRYNSLRQDMYYYNTATKGLLLNTTSKVREYILNSNDNDLIDDYLAWRDLKEQLARMYGYSKRKLKSQNIDLADMEQQANAMEKSLSERSSRFSSAFSGKENNPEELIENLNDTEALVDVLRIQNFDQDFTSSAKYIVFILKNNESLPQLVVLDNGAELESRYLKYYRNAIQNEIEDEYSYLQFWSKIDEKISDKKKIYFSPDGVFNQININTLKKPGGEYVIILYNLITIGNSKDLAKIKYRQSERPEKGAFLLGSPDYGTSEISMLPGTLTEINKISKILGEHGYKVNRYMHEKATEKNIKAMHSLSVVHIATHGYFQKDTDNSTGTVFGIVPENASNNPLLRSGLLLAGLGNALSDTTRADFTSNDNGILTAYEAMNLNLDETTLVVLSACETGLGDVKSGEGVYGLQRAFQMAGAEVLIMSLWKVNDETTQLLMTGFYNNLVESNDKQTALRNAQIELMEEYKSPKYWGAFVMIGG